MGIFVLSWVVVACIVAVYLFVFKKADKKKFWSVVRKVSLVSVIALAILFGLMALNNFSGL